MPDFKFFSSASQASVPTPTASTNCAGLALPDKIWNWAVFRALPYIIPFGLRIVEKFGIHKWYKTTDEERQFLLERYGDSKIYGICKFIEDNIEDFRQAAFIVETGLTLYDMHIQWQGVKTNDITLYDIVTARETTAELIYSHINLYIFILYDLVGLYIKKRLINNLKNEIPGRRDLAFSNFESLNYGRYNSVQGDSAPRLTGGNLQQQGIYLISTSDCQGNTIVRYSQVAPAGSPVAPAPRRRNSL